MKTGRELPELLKEVLRQQETKRDFVADTRKIEMTMRTDKVALAFGDQVTGIKETAHRQIGEHASIPKPYYDKMLAEAPDLLATNVNRWFAKYPAPRMIRTLDGSARAFLSDRYRPLDNSDLLEAALPPLLDMGVEVMSCEVTDRRLYLKVVDKRILRDLPTGWSPTNKGHQRFDTLSPALTLSNSEVGDGALACQTSVFTGGCSNMMVIRERSARKYHVGGKHELGEDVYRMLSDATKKLTDAALWSQIADVVRAAFDVAKFDATCDKLAAAVEDKIDADPIKMVEVTAKKFGMSDGERNSVLRHLISGGDLTKYGLHSAVTRAAEDLDGYDRASQFEQMGGVIVELPKSEWRELVKAAA
jgi:hypothetical protein